MSGDEVFDAFDRRKAQSSGSRIDEHRLKSDTIRLIRQRTPEVVAEMRKNGYQEYPNNKYRAREVTVDGVRAMVWPQPYGSGNAALGLYINGRLSPPQGSIVITDDLSQGQFRTASDADLMKLGYSVLNGTAEGLLKVLKAPEKVAVYILPDEKPPNPNWALHTIGDP